MKSAEATETNTGLSNQTASISQARTISATILRSQKIAATHLERLAVVYVRQSSPQQVQENRESRDRQYALADYAELLGWTCDRVMVVDEDQGQSGSSADHCTDFHGSLRKSR